MKEEDLISTERGSREPFGEILASMALAVGVVVLVGWIIFGVIL